MPPPYLQGHAWAIRLNPEHAALEAIAGELRNALQAKGKSRGGSRSTPPFVA